MNHKLEENKSIIEIYAQRVWNDKDLQAIDDLLHKDCVIHSVLGDFHGKEPMKNIAKAWLKGFPDLIVRNISVIAEEDLVVLNWHVQGTHNGEFQGIQPTGKKVSYHGATIYRLHHGKIVEYWAYVDMKNLLKMIS